MKRPSTTGRALHWGLRAAEFHARRSPLRSHAAQNRHCRRFLDNARRKGWLAPDSTTSK